MLLLPSDSSVNSRFIASVAKSSTSLRSALIWINDLFNFFSSESIPLERASFFKASDANFSKNTGKKAETTISAIGYVDEKIERFSDTLSIDLDEMDAQGERIHIRAAILGDIRLKTNVFWGDKIIRGAEAIKIDLGSCISVYNHVFAFPELVAIPATKRGNGGVSTKLSGYRTSTS
ncbi:hypothetical protein LXL04_023198 [Taraxacum kok-saghyz]